MSESSLYIGLMTGTSLDGIDAALLAKRDNEFHYLAHHEMPMPASLREALYSLYLPGENELARAAIAAWQHSEACAECVWQLLEKTGHTAENITAIGSHGQTLRHEPDHIPPFSIQIQHPARLAEITGIDVIADFRSRDIAAGGQGAPLAPLFHRGLLALESANIVNIGGIANLSILSANGDRGFDTGPGNGLMDAWISHRLQKRFDQDGQWAASGQGLPGLLSKLLADPFFTEEPPKSTGRDHFDLRWLAQFLSGNEPPQDVQHTLCQFTATTIAAAIRQYGQSETVILAGGGARNPLLVQMLKEQLSDYQLQPSPIPTQALEAAGFAWLAAQFIARQPCTLNPVTGGKTRILGALYPH